MTKSKVFGIIGIILGTLVTTISGQAKTAVTISNNNNIYLPVTYHNYDPSLAPIFGVQMYGSTRPTNLYYTSLINTKVSWVRNRVQWSTIEPIDVLPSAYDWASADNAYAAARPDMGGLNIIGTIEFAPSWAAPDSNGPLYSHALPDFAEFVSALVERYDGDGYQDAPGSPTVTYWEFYNEPDNNSDKINNPNFAEPLHWGDHGAEYANMLAIVYPTVKAANSNAQVVLGGLAFDWFEADGGPFVRSFLEDVLDAGGGAHFDVMNFHSYPAFFKNWTSHEGPGLLEKAQHIRSILAKHHLEKPLIITEAGWMSNQSPGVSIPGSPEIQSRYVVELLTESMAAELEVMIWWLLVDPPFPYPYKNGLITEADTRKMSYFVFQDVINKLGTAHFIRTLSIGETGNPRVEAFLFQDNVYKRNIYVAWLNPVNTTLTTPLSLPVSAATMHNSLTGVATNVYDANDGRLDGKITVQIDATPIYIEVEQ